MGSNEKRVFGESWFTEEEGKTILIGCQCQTCQNYWFPKRNICPTCFNEDLKEVTLSETAKIYAVTKLHVASKRLKTPLSIAYIDFPEGVRVCGQVSGDAKIGSKVVCDYGQIRTDADGVPVYSYKFKVIS